MAEMDERTAAPHGRDENGVPLTPFGINIDGTPRKSNRGARPGQRQGRPPSGKRKSMPTSAPTVASSVSSLTDVERKGMLLELATVYIVSPLAALSSAPLTTKYFGPKHADALAGDALILHHYAPGIADGAILMSKKHPKMLAWMDKLEGNAATMILASSILQAGKAFVENHLNPNPALAAAGRNLAAMKMAEMAMRINEEAAEMRAQMAMTEPTEQYPTAA